MTIVVQDKQNIKLLLESFEENKGKKRKSLKKHFGKLKRNFDGLDYQKKIRNEWS